MLLNKYLGTVKKIFVNPHWAIGIIDGFSAGDILSHSPEKLLWFKAPGIYDFYADCFITDHFGEPIIFFENWKAKYGLGVISYVRLSDVMGHTSNIDQYIHTVLKNDTHFSYPYLFEYENELYMLPENYQSNGISLYKAGSTPDEWTHEKVILPNIAGVDPVIFSYNDVWWLVLTVRSKSGDTADTDLGIWYADTPFGPWLPHAKNIIHSDKPIIRNGGTPFIHEGELYRPVQDCSQTYGGAVVIMHIVELTPDEFREEPVSRLSGSAPFEKACHTYSSCGNITVVDGNQAEYSLRMPLYFVKYVMNIFRKK